MTQQEIQERNKQIAFMLGAIDYKADKWYKLGGYKQHIYFPNREIPNRFLEHWLKFHSDWNWLMEAVEFINKTHKDNNPYRDLHYTIGYLLHGGWWKDTKIPERLLSNKTQLFLAVSDFAKLYNNKEL